MAKDCDIIKYRDRCSVALSMYVISDTFRFIDVLKYLHVHCLQFRLFYFSKYIEDAWIHVIMAIMKKAKVICKIIIF